MIDSHLILRPASTGNLTSSEQSAAGVDFRGPDHEAQCYAVYVPSSADTSTTLTVKIQESDDNSTWRDFLTFEPIHDKGQYFVTGKSDARYRRYHCTVTGTTANFGAVVIAPVNAGHADNY